MSDTFDFVIVGGGTTGCVLANRLSADPATTVLMIEAGGADITPAVEATDRWNELLLTDLDWAYMGVPQAGLQGRQVYSAAGRGIGGSSNIYHMMHTRGRPQDYDNWAYNGCTGWGFDEVLPWLQRCERQLDGTNPTAGRDGMINIVNARDTGNPVSATFIKACVELGYPEVADFNASTVGAGWHHVDVADGKRCSARTAYFDPIAGRPNLRVVTRAMASRIRFEGTRATGVDYLQGSETITALARREVILCTGTLQTPKLLMLSGIGGGGALSAHGIETRIDLPGVGANLQDHPLIIGPMGYLAAPPPPPRGNVTEVGLFCTSEPGMSVPDLEICLVHRAPFGPKFFEAVIERVQTGQPVANATELVDPRVILSLPGLVRPLSRGSVTLASASPHDHPVIDGNYFGERADLDRTVTMIEIARRIYATSAFRDGHGLSELSPGPDVRTRADLEAWVIANTGSYYHFAGTARMGIGRDAVVDSQLRVHGTTGLRVADASVMPTIVSANTHTTAVMIAERAADFVLRAA